MKTPTIKTAVVKSRVEPNTWLAITRNDVSYFVSYFDCWQDAMHWALIVERAEAAKEFRRRMRNLKNLLALEANE